VARAKNLKRNTNLNFGITASDSDNAAKAIVSTAPISDCADHDHGVVLIKFVHALAKRQARLDVRFAFDTTRAFPV
jgi:hypothetical protein